MATKLAFLSRQSKRAARSMKLSKNQFYCKILKNKNKNVQKNIN